MITANDNRRLDSAPGYHLVEAGAEASAFTLAQPANARGQALEGHLLPRQPNPPADMLVLRKLLQHSVIGGGQVGWVTGEHDPTEGALALTKEGANIGGHKAGVGEGI